MWPNIFRDSFQMLLLLLQQFYLVQLLLLHLSIHKHLINHVIIVRLWIHTTTQFSSFFSFSHFGVCQCGHYQKLTYSSGFSTVLSIRCVKVCVCVGENFLLFCHLVLQIFFSFFGFGKLLSMWLSFCVRLCVGQLISVCLYALVTPPPFYDKKPQLDNCVEFRKRHKNILLDPNA